MSSEKQLKGQMSIFDFPECIPDKVEQRIYNAPHTPQLPREPQKVPETFADYVGRCEYCMWGKDEASCHWSVNCTDKHHKSIIQECDENHSFWKPDSWKIPKLCGNCRHSNNFVCKCEKEEVDQYGVVRRDLDKPIEEPNIYCTRHDGSINRSRPYEVYCTPGFGVGHWHRQREWDTCDGWELDTQFHKNLATK